MTDRMLEGKAAVVTGSSRGIGSAIAELLGRAGADVVVNYHSDARAAARVVSTIVGAGSRAVAVQADVRDPSDCARLVDSALDAFGGVDILVSNASISFPVAPVLELDWDEVAAKLTGEMGAAFCICKAAAPHMLERGGDIVLISSGMSRVPIRGFAAHGSAKAALTALGRYLAVELAPNGVRVNVVAPGLVLSDATRNHSPEYHELIRSATPSGRISLPEDVAGAVLGVLNPWNRQMVGAYIPVNGGIDIV